MDSINVGGADRPIRFGWNALRIFSKEAGVGFMQMGDLGDMDMDQLTILVYAGLVHGANKEDKEVDFTVDDVGDWIDEDMDVLNKSLELFTEQMPKTKNQEPPPK